MPRELATVRDHGVRVWIISESQKGAPVYGHVGNRRWECEWYELTAGGRKRHEDPNYNHDHDRDEVCCVSVHASKAAAIAAGRKAAPESVYGCAIVQQHELVRDESYQAAGEWEPVGPQFEVDAQGEVGEV